MKWIWVALFFLAPVFLFSKEKPVIILDPGHGGKDEGTKVRNLVEKQLTLRTAYIAKKELETLGYRVILTRARDVFLPLGTRVQLANRRDFSLFVSIHYNSASSPAAKGIEIYYYSKGGTQRKEQSKVLAATILQEVIHHSEAYSRGTKQGNFQVIRETTMPAVLIEGGFVTNNEERALIGTEGYLLKLGKGIASGVDKYVTSKG